MDKTEDRAAPEIPATRRAITRDPLFALLIGNGLWGAALGLVFVAGVLALDLGHIRSLVLASPDGVTALALLSVGNIVTFASAAMGGAVMMASKKPPTPPSAGRRLGARLGEPVPAPVPAKAGRA